MAPIESIGLGLKILDLFLWLRDRLRRRPKGKGGSEAPGGVGASSSSQLDLSVTEDGAQLWISSEWESEGTVQWTMGENRKISVEAEFSGKVGHDDFLNGKKFLRSGFFREAFVEFENALIKGYEDSALQNERGIALHRLGRHEEALKAVKRAVELDKTNLDALTNLANTYRATKRYRKALAMYKKALRLQPNSFHVRFGQGNLFRDWEKFDLALKSYDYAIRISSTSPIAWNNRGFVLAHLGRLEEARNSFLRSIEILPEHDHPHGNLARVMCMLKDFRGALKAADDALRLNRNQPNALNAKALALKNLSRFEESEKYFRRVLNLEPDHLAAQANLGAVLVELGELDEAEALLLSARKGSPRDAAILNYLGSLRIKQGNRKEAYRCYARAVFVDRHSAVASSNLGYLYLEDRTFRLSLAFYTRATELDPTLVQAWNGRGAVLAELNKYREAEESFKKALELDPGNEAIQSNLEQLRRISESRR